MKKILMLGFLFGSFASAMEMTDKIEGAFTSDENVQAEMVVLKRQLRAALPNCTLRVVPELEGHLFAANLTRQGMAPAEHTKVYLVSQNIGCSLVSGTLTRAIRRSVTAKVVVRVRRLADGTSEENPQRVVLVNVTNDESEE